jgi:hypothetical protein
MYTKRYTPGVSLVLRIPGEKKIAEFHYYYCDNSAYFKFSAEAEVRDYVIRLKVSNATPEAQAQELNKLTKSIKPVLDESFYCKNSYVLYTYTLGENPTTPDEAFKIFTQVWETQKDTETERYFAQFAYALESISKAIANRDIRAAKPIPV